MSSHLIRTSTVKKYLANKIQENDVLRYGQFKLNSEVLSDFYYDFSQFNTAQDLTNLGFVLAKTIKDLNIHFDMIVGTAYKGIVLCLATTQELLRMTGQNVEWAFDRKEKKNHGEGGQLVGASPFDKKVLIVDDVVTSGKALQRAVNTVMTYSPKSIECLVLVDRSSQTLPFHLHTVLSHQEVLQFLGKK